VSPPDRLALTRHNIPAGARTQNPASRLVRGWAGGAIASDSDLVDREDAYGDGHHQDAIEPYSPGPQGEYA